MPDFGRLILASLTGAGLVLGVLWLVERPIERPSDALEQAPVDDLRLAPKELSARMNELQLTQQQLLDDVAALRQQVTQIPSDGGAIGLAEAPDPQAQGNNQARPLDAALTFDRLLATGVDKEEAESLVQRLDELALARLTADYRVRQATGDNEQRRSAREERRLIPQDSAAIRQEFGDTAYDSYLYASGQPNRVEVASVLRSSAAVAAGLQPGDVLRSLDGNPLYSVRDLTSRVREGSPDQTYALSIERSGEAFEVWVPGGPLGVRVNGSSVAPNN